VLAGQLEVSLFLLLCFRHNGDDFVEMDVLIIRHLWSPFPVHFAFTATSFETAREQLFELECGQLLVKRRRCAAGRISIAACARLGCVSVR
jgi:hypothetical protein